MNQGTVDDGIPTEYRVEISETPLKLKVFSQDGSGRMAIEGTVKNSCTIMAQRNDEYSKMCKQRLIKSMVKTRCRFLCALIWIIYNCVWAWLTYFVCYGGSF